MKEPFEEIEAEDHRLTLIKQAPVFEHSVTREQLAKVNEATGERWVLMNLIGQKLDWLIERHIELNNDAYYLETETIRSKKFRQYVWTRVTVVVVIAAGLFQILPWLVRLIFK